MFLILSDLDVEYIDGIYFKPLDTNSLEYLKKREMRNKSLQLNANQNIVVSYRSSQILEPFQC